MSDRERQIEIPDERVIGRTWTIYVCAEPDGQDCDSGTHPKICRHRCKALKRFHAGEGHGPALAEVPVRAAVPSEVTDEQVDRAILAGLNAQRKAWGGKALDSLDDEDSSGYRWEQIAMRAALEAAR